MTFYAIVIAWLAIAIKHRRVGPRSKTARRRTYREEWTRRCRQAERG